MGTTPPGKSTGREIVERAAEAALGSVPVVGATLAVTFVTAVGWRLEERREAYQRPQGMREVTAMAANSRVR